MSRKLIILVLLPILLLAACGEAQDEPDFDATVAAAVAATGAAEVAAAPTATALPPTTVPDSTDPPPTTTPEPTEVPLLDLDATGLSAVPADLNVSRTAEFHLTVDDTITSALRVDGQVNAGGTGTVTYDFSNRPQVTVADTITVITTGDTTYYDLGNETCVTGETVDEPVETAVLAADAAVLNVYTWLTGQLPLAGVVEVNGVQTNEYNIALENLTPAAPFTTLDRGVLNVGMDGTTIVRLILEGSGESAYLAPDETGAIYYELNNTPGETAFEIVVPPACLQAAATATPAAATAVPTPEAELVIVQSADTVFHECQGGNIVVAGAGNSVVLGGACGTVLVNGIGNSLEVANAASIVVNGATNTITYSGSPVISNNGIGNVFTQR